MDPDFGPITGVRFETGLPPEAEVRSWSGQVGSENPSEIVCGGWSGPVMGCGLNPDSILGPREQGIFKNWSGVSSRLHQWLSGRLAAKAAVARFVSEAHGLDLDYPEIEIIPDPNGRPTVCGRWRKKALAPVVSISHTREAAAALAGVPRSGLGPGIDIEKTGRPLSPGFLQTAFTDGEMRLLRDMPRFEEWALRFWCAKEAAAKAVGSGLVGLTYSFRIVSADAASGLMKTALTGRRIGTVLINTFKYNGHVAALTCPGGLF